MSQANQIYLKGINIKDNLYKNNKINWYLEDFKFNMDLLIILLYLLKMTELNFTIICQE